MSSTPLNVLRSTVFARVLRASAIFIGAVLILLWAIGAVLRAEIDRSEWRLIDDETELILNVIEEDGLETLLGFVTEEDGALWEDDFLYERLEEEEFIFALRAHVGETLPGYPNPNRSHFRSIEIWNAGQGTEARAQEGWVSTSFAPSPPGPSDADGLVLGGDLGPLRGPGRFSVLENEETFLETLHALEAAPHAIRPAQKSALDHVLDTYESAKITGTTIANRLERAEMREFDFPGTYLGEQLRSAARLMDAGVDVPVFKVMHSGFDTHEGQPDTHADLLEALSDAIHAFTRALKRMGRWEDVTIVTYSEFGRTAHENGSAGTDHGTAAPVCVAGGGVQGGFSGQRVDLTRLKDDDLVHTTDYRAVYAGLLSGLWGIEAPMFQGFSPAPLTLFS